MPILDGLPSNEAELKNAVELAAKVVELAMPRLNLTPKQQSVIDLAARFKMKAIRQLEVAELMVSANNYSVNYAKALLATNKPWARIAEAKYRARQIEQDARRLSAIVRGHNSAYDATPWNSDNRLGMYFKILFPEETKRYGDPGVALFMWLAWQLMEGAATIEKDPAVEYSVKRRLERIVVDVVARLLREKH